MSEQLNASLEWEVLLKKSENELLLELGTSLAAGSLAMAPESASSLRLKAEFWLGQQRSRICSSQKVREAAKSSDLFVICAAIADAIGGAGAATAAVLIVKKGVEKLCEDLWA